MSQIQPYSTQKEPRSETQAKKTISESSELAHGQSVIVVARWILVVTGLFLIIWNPDQLDNLRMQVMTILVLALMNFFLQAQILMGRKTIAPVVYFASMVDFLVITLLVWLTGGFESNTYIFYFPAILAIAVAFDTTLTYGYVSAFAGIYALLCLVTGGADSADFPILVSRILMMVAIAFCGNLYWHIERNRREAAQKAHNRLIAEVRRERPRRASQTEEANNAHTA